MRNPVDDRVHWSELRQIGKSPKHYAHACTRERHVTREMLVGAIFDAMVLGVRKVALYPGKVRNGKEWEAFQAAHPGAIHCIASEYNEAKGAADAVLEDPFARPLIDAATKQVVMRWTYDGVPCASGVDGDRGGFDLLWPSWIRDLKLTSCTEPETLNRHILAMGWHEQLVFYREGARANGYDIQLLGLICVEAKAPHCVTCVRLSPAMIELGERAVRSYIERYKACEASGHWPPYVQTEIESELPPWMQANLEMGDEDE